jgi:hypothetical protein
MIGALWGIGLLAVVCFAATVSIVLAPPGDNVDARSLGEMVAIVPFGLGVVLIFIWLVLAAIHWI